MKQKGQVSSVVFFSGIRKAFPFSATFAFNATWLASASAREFETSATKSAPTILVRDVRTGIVAHSLVGHERPMNAMTFVPTFTDILISSDVVGSIKVGDVRAGKRRVAHVLAHFVSCTSSCTCSCKSFIIKYIKNLSLVYSSKMALN
jgi:WD40 repeat protein